MIGAGGNVPTFFVVTSFQDDLEDRVARGCVLQTTAYPLGEFAGLPVFVEGSREHGIPKHVVLAHRRRSRAGIRCQPKHGQGNVELGRVVDERDAIDQKLARNRNLSALNCRNCRGRLIRHRWVCTRTRCR